MYDFFDFFFLWLCIVNSPFLFLPFLFIFLFCIWKGQGKNMKSDYLILDALRNVHFCFTKNFF